MERCLACEADGVGTLWIDYLARGAALTRAISIRTPSLTALHRADVVPLFALVFQASRPVSRPVNDRADHGERRVIRHFPPFTIGLASEAALHGFRPLPERPLCALYAVGALCVSTSALGLGWLESRKPRACGGLIT